MNREKILGEIERVRKLLNNEAEEDRNSSKVMEVSETMDCLIAAYIDSEKEEN